MASTTSIEWTRGDDGTPGATWNPVTGCSVVSPGCTNCYAMRLAGTRLQHHPSRAGLTRETKAGPVWTGEVRLNEEWLDQPLRWRKPRRIFVCAHGDLFHESVPDEWIDRVFAVMALAPRHVFQLLTKRPERMRAYINGITARPRAEQVARAAVHIWGGIDPDGVYQTVMDRLAEAPLPNCWLGTSAEDQRRADERIPELLATPAAVRFVSAEPLLGPVTLPPELLALGSRAWCIVGGESGPGARPMHPEWARSLRDQCAAAGVPFHFKQWGEWAPLVGAAAHRFVGAEECRAADGYLLGAGRRGAGRVALDWRKRGGVWLYRVGKRAAGRLLDGVQHDGMPG